MEQIADRLRQAREKAGFAKAADACEAFGIKYSTYAGHENGSRGIRGDALKRYARNFNVSVEWLLTGKGGKLRGAPEEITVNGDTYLPVPVYDIRASAGAGALAADSTPLAHQVFRQQWLSRLTRASPENLAVIQVSGDSMWTTLHDGDTVLIDRTVSRIVKDGIYIIQFEDELLVKRCQRDLETGHVIVSSDNPAYQSFNVTNVDRLSVIGRVIWIGRALG